MFSKKFVLACSVAALGLTVPAVQARVAAGKAAGAEVQVMDARAAMLARLDQRVMRFCSLNRIKSGLVGSNAVRETELCRADLVNELTIKASDIQLVGGVLPIEF